VTGEGENTEIHELAVPLSLLDWRGLQAVDRAEDSADCSRRRGGWRWLLWCLGFLRPENMDRSQTGMLCSLSDSREDARHRRPSLGAVGAWFAGFRGDALRELGRRKLRCLGKKDEPFVCAGGIRRTTCGRVWVSKEALLRAAW